jgi:hypothetical protein
LLYWGGVPGELKPCIQTTPAGAEEAVAVGVDVLQAEARTAAPAVAVANSSDRRNRPGSFVMMQSPFGPRGKKVTP